MNTRPSRPATPPADRDPAATAPLAEPVVVAGPITDMTALAGPGGRPVVVTPARPAGVDPASAPVLLGVGPTTPAAAVELAFTEAACAGVPLWAVRAWWEPGVDLGRPGDRRLARWDAACDRYRAELLAQLSASMAHHTDVVVRPMTVNDRCADVLLALAARARLVVVGSPTGDSRRPSPVTALTRDAPCPVLVVPARRADTPATTADRGKAR